MSIKTELKLQQTIDHIKQHRSIAHKRILDAVGAAMLAFQKNTGCTLSTIDIDISDVTSVGEPGSKVSPTRVHTTIKYRNINLL